MKTIDQHLIVIGLMCTFFIDMRNIDADDLKNNSQ